MLTDDQITKFQFIWKQRFNQEISKEEALKQGIKLVNLIRVICRPDNQQNQKENNNYEN